MSQTFKKHLTRLTSESKLSTGLEKFSNHSEMIKFQNLKLPVFNVKIDTHEHSSFTVINS
jgi:hypothetical protein